MLIAFTFGDFVCGRKLRVRHRFFPQLDLLWRCCTTENLQSLLLRFCLSGVVVAELLALTTTVPVIEHAGVQWLAFALLRLESSSRFHRRTGIPLFERLPLVLALIVRCTVLAADWCRAAAEVRIIIRIYTPATLELFSGGVSVMMVAVTGTNSRKGLKLVLHSFSANQLF